MKTPMTIRKMTAAILLSVGTAASAAAPIDSAHEAYLKGDFTRMAIAIREAVKSPDAVSRRNALELLAKAYEARGGAGIPVDWKVPPEIRKLKIAVKRVHKPQGDEYGIEIQGETAEKGIVRQLQLVRFPDEVVLDKQKKIGDWVELTDPENGPEFELEGARTPQPIPEGLYLVNLELRSGATTRGWVILSDLASTQTPAVTTPSVGQTFSTALPSFRWEDFRSPQYKSHERRTLWLGVTRSTPPEYPWTEVWSRFTPHPRVTETTIGADPEGHGVKQLESGRYTFYVSYKESRQFGDVVLQRQSVTTTPFFVKTK